MPGAQHERETCGGVSLGPLRIGVEKSSKPSASADLNFSMLAG